MSQNQLQNIEQLEAHLWDAADNLRANSKLTAGEYCMPVLGVIFLRHATNRYNEALREIQADQAAGKMPKRPLTAADFKKRRALLLPKEARYDTLLALPKGADLGTALVDAMNAIERDFEPLLNQLPKEYTKFENTLLEDLLRVFDSETLRTASGDVFGRINEYFLMKFAMQGAQDNGEFFTPPSLVQTIVNVIEPDHGTVFDPACGSGGMFVQSSHFIEQHGQSAAHRATFFGQEYKPSNLRLAKMNLAAHALEGDIVEANTFHQDEHELLGKCDLVMANPPFNVDKVDAEKVKDDRRLPFGLPGVNKDKKVSNGNYLWISYFWSYLNKNGRAGYGRRGDIGRRAFISGRHAGWFCGTGSLRIRPNRKEINPRYLFDTLGSPETAGTIANRAKGATMPNLNGGVLKSVPVLVAPRSLQDIYAEQVGPMADMIETLAVQNQKLRAARDLLLPRLITVEIVAIAGKKS